MILGRIKLAIGGALAALVALLAAWVAILRNRAVRAENRGLSETIKAHEVRNEVDNRIATERDARQRLRDGWAE